MRPVRILFILTAILMSLAGPAFAVEPDEVLADPALEARARALSTQLRCMVCQNQSIDDSDAELAKDLRVLVRERLVEGDTDAQVIDYVVDRYGEFVLLKPRFSATNLVLWLTAPLVLLIGAVGFFFYARRQIPARAAAILDEEEKRRLAKILEERD